MRILGIDPGLATVGIGIVDSTSPHDVRVVDWLTITTPAGLPLGTRLKELYNDLKGILEEFRPNLAVIERLYFATNERTAIDVAQARGITLLAIEEAAIPSLSPTPLQLKSAIAGDGKADKRQVQDMLVRLLGLKEIPKPDDAADALALAVYGAVSGERFLTQQL